MNDALPFGLGQIVVYEEQVPWSAALRCALRKKEVDLAVWVASTTLPTTESALRCPEDLFLCVEIGMKTLSTRLPFLAELRRRRGPPAVAMVVAPEEPAARVMRNGALEAGAVLAIDSPRSMGLVAQVALRSLQSAASKRSLPERAWASLPWQSMVGPVG